LAGKIPPYDRLFPQVCGWLGQRKSAFRISYDAGGLSSLVGKPTRALNSRRLPVETSKEASNTSKVSRRRVLPV
jgi:hypothetical protein